MATLTELVFILAEWHAESRDVKDLDGSVSTVGGTVAPLLTSLEASCASGVERSGRSGGFSSKVLLAVDAIDLAAEIRGDLIGDLVSRNAPIRVQGLAELLLHWHRVLLDDLPSWTEAEQVERLAGWEARIRALLDPPKRMRVEECPLCRKSRWSDGEIATDMAWIELDRAHPVASMTLLCHSCGRVAQGLHAVAAVLGTSVREGLRKLGGS